MERRLDSRSPVIERPRIGITRGSGIPAPTHLALQLAVRIAGGIGVTITPRTRIDPALIDGLIVSGGADISPHLFNMVGKKGHRYDHLRDTTELALLAYAERNDIPVLGVCRGAHLMNAHRGGTLHLSVRKAYKNARYPSHVFAHLFFRKRITIAPGSLVSRITGRDEIAVNSLHRQSVDAVGSGLVVTAHEQNGVVQAIEDNTREFFIGVQFHPELLIYRPSILKLFRALVAESARRSVR